MMKDIKYITIQGAREHNLKNVDLRIPRNQFVVFTGLSGSGKSSLAFDTIYAEGQRRYVESLSSYARMFLGQADKPDVDKIDGLSPAISIDQKSTNRNPRSTVGTVTEIYDYLRLLFARIGVPHCPKCGKPIERQTVDQMVDRIMTLPEKTKFQVLSPVVRGRKGEHEKVLAAAKRSGFARVVVDGNPYDLDEEIKLEKNKKHSIDIVVDRLVMKEGIELRLAGSLEAAMKHSEGLVKIDVIGGETLSFSDSFACPDCGISIDEIEPRSFSFNNPFGACPVCTGLGFKSEFDPDLMIPDKTRSLNEGAIAVMGWQSSGDKKSYSHALLEALSKELIKNCQQRYKETASEAMRAEYEEYMTLIPCEACGGKRLKPASLAVTIGDRNIYDLTELSVTVCGNIWQETELTDRQNMIGEQILKEIEARLTFMADVGLNYLTLSRPTGTLSGGEAQRIRLATQIGSGLVGVAYILDEPSIGLHQRDNDKLIATLKHLRDLGNTLIVVEHDEDTMRAADYIVDVGPMAGVHGGEIVATGTAEDIMKCKDSITGQYLSISWRSRVRRSEENPRDGLPSKGRRQNNLKNIDVEISPWASSPV